MSTKIEIKLAKAQAGVKWTVLEGDEEDQTATTMSECSSHLLIHSTLLSFLSQ